MKKKIGMIAAIVILILAAFLAPVIKQRNMQKRFEEQMDLGNRYLLEQNYEAAVVAFGKAIEIDPRQAESYRKMAEAYVGLGDYENAVLTLEKGYEFTGEESLREYQEEVIQMKERQERRAAVIQGLYEACLVSDEDGLYEILYGDEYRQMKNEWEFPLFYPEQNGMALGIYQKGIYFGELVDGIREGEGKWYFPDETVRKWRYRFTGSWKHDYPNGNGEEDQIYWNDSPGMEAEGTEHEIVRGSYRDGYADGEMSVTGTYYSETEQWSDSFHFRANYGVYEIIAVEGDEYVISYENGMVSIDEPGIRNVGVWGAMKDLTETEKEEYHE